MRSVSHRYARGTASATMLVLLSVAAFGANARAARFLESTTGQRRAEFTLTIHVGDADLLFGGFIDATAIRRTVNTGSGLGTSFGTIPFGNTVQGHMNDTQFSSQNSRLTLQATSKAGTADLKGVPRSGLPRQRAERPQRHRELPTRCGCASSGASIGRARSSSSAGQSWSLMTPNRNGLSPETADVFFSQTVDPNYQMGLTWGRTMQFRLTTHPNDTFTAAVSIENPDQYVGGGVRLPAGFPAGEVDTGAAVNDVPNPFPDIIGKIAFDPKIGRTHQHIDAAVLVRNFKTYNLGTDTTFRQDRDRRRADRRHRADSLGSPGCHRLLFLGRRPLHRQYRICPTSSSTTTPA